MVWTGADSSWPGPIISELKFLEYVVFNGTMLGSDEWDRTTDLRLMSPAL